MEYAENRYEHNVFVMEEYNMWFMQVKNAIKANFSSEICKVLYNI